MLAGRWLLSVASGSMIVAVVVLPAQGPAAAARSTTTPTRGTQLYATNFDPATFNKKVVGSSASLTKGPGASLVCTVGSAGSKMIASVKSWSVSTITLRDPNYHNEGPRVSVPTLGNASATHFVVIDTSPRYRVYVNGTLAIDYTDTFSPSKPGGFGLDCASQAKGTGSDSVSNFSLYTVRW